MLSFGQTHLADCRNNIIVWTGPGEFPGDVPDDPSCVTITTDRTVWDAAREAWLSNHPQVARLAGIDDPLVVDTGDTLVSRRNPMPWLMLLLE